MKNRENFTKADWLAKADQFQKESKRKSQEASDSFDRCDTDGFLSQWALGRMSNLDRYKKELCENFGLHTFLGLYKNGRRIKAKKIIGAYGSTWLLHEDERQEFGGRTFLPYNHGRGRSKILKSFGIEELDVKSPAWVDYPNRGGYYSCVVYYRYGNQWGEKDQLIKERV
tara:strand:+ start:343 stop:852 length:510 start_codon:yes stop_codon:yes gene_type:complete